MEACWQVNAKIHIWGGVVLGGGVRRNNLRNLREVWTLMDACCGGGWG